MIKENRHINDDFIPNGLEFKDEYFEQAMAMYQREKLILRWRKVGIVAASVAAAVSLLIAVMFVRDDKAVLSTNQQSAEHSLRLSNEPQKQKSVVSHELSIHENDSLNGVLKEKSVSHDNEVPAFHQIESRKEQALNERAFVHENVVSSGATSSGSSPNYSGKAPGQRGVTSSGVAPHVRELVFDELQDNRQSSQKHEPIVKSPLNNQEVSLPFELNLNESGQGTHQEANNSSKEMTFLPYRMASFESANADLMPHMKMEIPNQRRLQFYLGAGIGLWADYGRNKESALPAGYFGECGMEYTMKGGWSAGFGAHGSLINQPANPVLIENTNYGQGFNTTAQTIFTDHLYYAGAQWSVGKNIGLKNKILLGYSLDYLITGNNTITTNRYSSFESFPSEEIKTKGYVAGFENVNHAVVLEYRRNFGNYFAGFRGQFGLTDITKQGVFLYENQERNSLITVNLGLKLNS